MAKNKKKNSDEETLKHYTSYNEKDLPAGILKQINNAQEDNPPQFIKADVSVDKIMSRRKNAVINNPPPEKDSDS